jgi:hypothetical protein
MMLRAGHIPAPDVWYRHSAVAHQLYADVLESELLLSARLSQLIAWSALHGHPSADLGKAVPVMRTHYLNALASVPYLTGGRSGEDALMEERRALAKKYQEHKARVLQGNTLRTGVRDRTAGIKKIGHAHV